MKLQLFYYHRFAFIFFVIYALTLANPLQIYAADSIIPKNSQVEATISSGVINVVIREENIADNITVSVMPYIAESFVGYNYIMPGLKKEGILEIKNETGEIYKVVDYNFTAEIANLQRIYNDAAQSYFGPASSINYEKVIALSGDAWYQINADYFGEENFINLDVLRKMFGWGDRTQGVTLRVDETGQKMLDLGFHYLFQNCIQFSFNANTNPVNNYDTKNIHILDYVNKADANKVLVLNEFFADEIGVEDIIMNIGYSMDNSSIGNSYNGSYADFGFELILERIVNEESETIEPEKPESKPEIENPDIIGRPNPLPDSSSISDDETPPTSDIIPEVEVPLSKNPKTGMPDNTISISLLFVFSSIALLIHKKRQ